MKLAGREECKKGHDKAIAAPRQGVEICGMTNEVLTDTDASGSYVVRIASRWISIFKTSLVPS